MLKMRRRHARLLTAIVGVAVVGTLAAVALGSPGFGNVTTLLVAKADFNETVHLNSDRIKFQTKGPTDVRIRTITFAPGGYSGWHHDPGFALVDRGRFAVQLDDVRTELSERSRVRRIRRRAGGRPQHEQRPGDDLLDGRCAGRGSTRLPDRGRSAAVRVSTGRSFSN